MRSLAALPYTGYGRAVDGYQDSGTVWCIVPANPVLARGSNQFVANFFFDGIEIMRGQWLWCSVL